MANTKITLEDLGQDLLWFIVDENTLTVIEAGPFHNELYKDSIIPIDQEDLCSVGMECPIHNPPNINHGFLKYKIVKIENNII